MSGDRPSRQRVLVVPTGRRSSPALLARAIADIDGEAAYVHVVLPVQLPPQLPISASPPIVVEAIAAQRQTAVTAIRSRRLRGRVEEVRCRSLGDVVRAFGRSRGLVRIVLVGSASWSLRRACHGLAPVTVVRDDPARDPAPSSHPVPTSGTIGLPAGRP
jgi:hypothetical protein